MDDYKKSLSNTVQKLNENAEKRKEAAMKAKLERAAGSMLSLIDSTSGSVQEQLLLEIAFTREKYEAEHGQGSFDKSEDFIKYADEILRECARGKITGDKERIKFLQDELRKINLQTSNKTQ